MQPVGDINNVWSLKKYNKTWINKFVLEISLPKISPILTYLGRDSTLDSLCILGPNPTTHVQKRSDFSLFSTFDLLSAIANLYNLKLSEYILLKQTLLVAYNNV